MSSTPPIVGVGASAGGLEALREMLSSAELPLGLAFVVVQHLDPTHESMLAQLLDRQTSLSVLQCEGGERIEADTVYIIPPGHGLAINQAVLELTEFSQPRGLRRPIDDFFISLAADQQANAACVILSGTGADGTTGLRAIKEHGGVAAVQKPDTARYDGMPLSAVGTGLVDFVEPPDILLGALKNYFHRRLSESTLEDEAELVADHVDDLCRVLRSAVGHDFSGYKRSTFIRRVERRMQVLDAPSGRAYLERIRNDTHECEALFRDLLINVTRFFRDFDAFETLRERVIEPLVKSRSTGEEVRIWIPGCSSGEEAYSIAMLCAEVLRGMEDHPTIQIFATDIDERMLEVAREGDYPSSALADIPYALRERHVTPRGERFVMTPAIRDMIRFSNHSVVKDPPFSRIDLVSCRNLLIYFDDRFQQSVLPLLHYSIRPGGYLFLGPSESIGRYENLFSSVDHGARLFERRPGQPRYPIDLPAQTQPRSSDNEPRRRERKPQARQDAEAMQRVMDRYAPPSMVLDTEGNILSAYGRLGRYLDFPVSRIGGASAVSLARPGLRNVLGRLLRECRQSRKRAIVRDVEVTADHGVQRIDVVCDPLPDDSLLFILRDTAPFESKFEPDIDELDPGDDHVEVLEGELRDTRQRLRTTVEELETTNEELKSSNEEMMSMNEELQSTNEELSTVNDELKSKVDQLTVANSDLRNFLDSTDLAVVVLDSRLCVRSYTEPATEIFPLQPSDRERPLEDVASRLSSSEYLDDARAVANGEPARHRRLANRDGSQTYSLRTMPYRTHDGSIDGATLVMTNITEALTLERSLAEERERLKLAIKAGHIGVWEYDVETGETFLDATEKELLDAPNGDVVHIDTLMDRIVDADRAEVESALRRASGGESDFEATFRIETAYGDTRHIKGFGRLAGDGRGGGKLTGVSIDITAEYALAETRELMLREMNHRVKNLFAIMGGLVSAGARSHTNLKDFVADLRERISGLGRAHSLSSSSNYDQAIDLEELVLATLDPYRDHTSIEIGGPEVSIDHRYLSSLALMMHEWTTNSVKYGALASDRGRLAIGWEQVGGLVRLKWHEDLDEAVEISEGSGFGTVLVQTSARQLQADVRRRTDGNAFIIEVDLPDAVLASQS
ncbi:CheR family methyltransferase [Pararhizobium mangrovi]|uniref:Blue-light-activated histidine kinase n=1 Tax=Pararhizobium mangrovi TaxID=2590452 RepID=A0A506TZI5_9HYPH|nr:CheR family methyltransferase [Pararhizobium mangrovi]TPW26154.1 chemotaxis protein [Pararhizobium mangrovi]